MRRTVKAASALGTLAGGLMGWGAWQAYQYTHPPRNRPLLHPRDLNIPFEEFVIPNGEVRLACWLLPAETGRTIVLLHGTPLDKSILLRFGRRLQQRGFTVLLLDFRAHGSTQGGARTFGYLEAGDVLAAVRYLRGRSGGNPGGIGLMGFSMGAVAALLAAARDPNIGAVVADSPFADLRDVIRRRRSGPAARVLMPVTARLAERWFGVSMLDDSPRAVAAQIGPRPVLLIHGDADLLTPLDHSRELYELLSEPKELWIVEGAAHVEASTIAPDEYLARVVAFFERNLPADGRGDGPE